ncbi:hypothetical protein FRB96_003745 [Tulasnella sp. 330]|nr:hypothetical protein FRB96_003745 [Tulasnella sp. 330]
MDQVLALLVETVAPPPDPKARIDIPLSQLDAFQIDSIVQSLNTALRHLQDDIHARIAKYNSYRNTIAPYISLLPVEMLSRILVLSVPLEHWSVGRLQELAQVSKHWKSIVTDSPELWAIAKVQTCPDEDPRWEEDLRLALRMSSQAPLMVACGVTEEQSALGAYEWQSAKEFMRIVGEHSTRWRSIQYNGASSSHIITELERPAPLLQSIRINFTAHGSDMAGRCRPIRFTCGARLQEVKAHGALFLWSALCGLKTLRLSSVSDPKARSADFLRMLASCPHLEVLSLSDMEISASEEGEDDPSQLSSVRLSALRDLTISQVEPCLTRALVSQIFADNIHRWLDM